MTEQERRQFTRIPYQAKALVEQSGNKYAGRVLDLSLNGVLIELSALLNRQDEVVVHIVVDDMTPAITMHTIVVHHVRNHYGLQCHEIDIDSMLQLRAIIGIHNDDPNAFRRESRALWELKIKN